MENRDTPASTGLIPRPEKIRFHYLVFLDLVADELTDDGSGTILLDDLNLGKRAFGAGQRTQELEPRVAESLAPQLPLRLPVSLTNCLARNGKALLHIVDWVVWVRFVFQRQRTIGRKLDIS